MINPKDNSVVIVGLPATGKTTLAEELLEKNPDFKLIMTDAFLIEGEHIVDYELLYHKVINEKSKKVLVEGVGAFELLCMGVKRFWCPDLIIFCVAKSSDREIRYTLRGKNFEGGKMFDRQLMDKWWQFRSSNNARRARIIDYIT